MGKEADWKDVPSRIAIGQTERPHDGTEPGLQEADYRCLCRFCVVS